MDDTIARIFYKIGVSDFQNGNLKLAEEDFLEAFEVYKKLIIIDSKEYHVLYSNTAEMLSRVYFAVGDDAKGETYKAISIDTLNTFKQLSGSSEDDKEGK